MDHICGWLQCLEGAGLVVNLPKCEIAQPQGEFLGHVVGLGKVKPRTAKIQAILDLPVPQTRKQVLRVLTMSGFDQRFLPNFAAVTEPLTNLLKKRG